MAGIHIYDWMISDLKLSGNELLVFATVYGFSQDGESEYRGGYRWLSTFLNVSEKTTRNILASLTEKGVIAKRVENINGVVFNRFAVCPEISTPTQNLPYPLVKITNRNKRGNIKESLYPSEFSDNNKLLSSYSPDNKDKKDTPKSALLDILMEKFPQVASDKRAVEAIADWVESRKRTNKRPPTDKAIVLAIRKAIRFSKEEPQFSVADFFDNATLCGWTGIYRIKDEQASSSSKKGFVAPDANCSQMDDIFSNVRRYDPEEDE